MLKEAVIPYIGVVLAAAASVGMIAGIVHLLPNPTSYTYELQVVTTDGELFIAGEGRSCTRARYQAVYPKNIRTIDCVAVQEAD